MPERTDSAEQGIGGLPLVEGSAMPVVLTEHFHAIARAAQIPAELLASYVCEEWEGKHELGQPLILLIDHRELGPVFNFSEDGANE